MKLQASTQRKVEQGELLSATDLQLGAVTCSTCYQQILDMFERFDYFALPTAQVWPFEATLERPKSIGGRSVDTHQCWIEVVIQATLAALFAISVPAGFNVQGIFMA